MDRQRLLDMEQRLSVARGLMYLSLGVGFLICIPWTGWIILPTLAWASTFYAFAKRRHKTSERPEYWIGLTVLNGQAMIGLGIALAGGPASPALMLMLLPVINLAPRFSRLGVFVGTVISAAAVLAATIPVDPSAFLANPTFTVSTIATIVGIAAFSGALMNAEVTQRTESLVDGLTGLQNRRALTTRFADLHHVALATGRPLSIALFDLDRFKTINDLYGHDRGDAVLADSAAAIRRTLGSDGEAFRLGGEEFVVVLPSFTEAQAFAIADALRRALSGCRPGDLPVTASFGVAGETGEAADFMTLYRRADGGLYRAKHQGRNQGVVAAANETMTGSLTAPTAAAGVAPEPRDRVKT